MGIAGLTQFIAKNMPNIFDTCELQDCIVDGNALTYFISKSVNWLNGQQYRQLEYYTLQILELIPKNSVYVFDGALCDYKTQTRRERNLEKAARLKQLVSLSVEKSADQYAKILSQNLLPPFAINVVFKTLSRNGKNVCFASEEADLLIASMAKAMNRPVLSMDSDYFLFDLPKGYIPLSTMSVNGKARLYNRKRFCNSTAVSHNHLHILAVLAGNDILSKTDIEDLYNSNPGLCLKQYASNTSKRIKAIIKLCSTLGKLSRIEAQNAVLKRVTKDWTRKLEYAFELAYDQYSNCYSPSLSLSPELKRLESGNLDPKVLEIINLNVFYCNPFFPSNFDGNVWNRAKLIRQHIYEILNVETVTEHWRFNSLIEESLIPRIGLDQNSYDFALLSRISFELVQSCGDLDDAIVVVMRYLILEHAINGTLLGNHEISGIICSFLTSLNLKPTDIHPFSKKNVQPTLSSLGMMGSIESILFCLHILHQVSGKKDLGLCKLIDGVTFLYVSGRIKRGALPKDVLEKGLVSKFEDLYQRSIDSLHDFIDIVFDY